jgi:hypothetical protein
MFYVRRRRLKRKEEDKISEAGKSKPYGFFL